jgi:hypothetical protein
MKSKIHVTTYLTPSQKLRLDMLAVASGHPSGAILGGLLDQLTPASTAKLLESLPKPSPLASKHALGGRSRGNPKPPPAKKPRVIKCQVCKEPGHNRATCKPLVS